MMEFTVNPCKTIKKTTKPCNDETLSVRSFLTENICYWLLSFSPPFFWSPSPYTWPWKTRCKFERGFTRWCRRPSNGGLPPHWRRWRPEPRRVGGFFRRRRPLAERPCPSETCVCWSLVGPHGITLQHFKGIHVYPSWHCHMCCSAMALHSQGIAGVDKRMVKARYDRDLFWKGGLCSPLHLA